MILEKLVAKLQQQGKNKSPAYAPAKTAKVKPIPKGKKAK
jgi:hypothetical protein